MKRCRPITAAAVGMAGLLLALSGCSSKTSDAAQPQAPLRLGAIATGSAPEEKQRYEKTAQALSQALRGRPVQVVTSTDYYAIVEGLRGGKLDIGFINSLGYVVAKARTEIEPLVVGVDANGQPGYYSYLITTAAKGVSAPADVRGKKLALASKLSTSGYLFPLDALRRAGIDPAKDTTLAQGGNHAANILAVSSGQVDAAFVDSVEFDSAVRGKKIDPAKVTIAWKSDRITGSPVVARPGLPAAERDAIKAALLTIKGDTEHRIGVEKAMTLAEARDADYEPIRKLATEAGIDLDAFKK